MGGSISGSGRRSEAIVSRPRRRYPSVLRGDLAQGRYDAVVISEAPSDEVAAKFALTIGAQGNVRTETVRAFTEDEYRKIVSGLP